MRIALIGVGAMGFNHARVISRIVREEVESANLEYIVDLDLTRAKKAAKLYGGKPVRSIDEISEIDLAFIATPTNTHFEIASKLIDKGTKYLFIEKPLTNNIRDAVELIEKAQNHNVEISVGYIERFNPAVVKLLAEIKDFLREPLTLLSRRIGPFSTRVGDTDVIYDLGVHEVDLHILILKRLPERIRTYGLKNIVSNLYDHAWINMDYSNVLSSIEVNRITPFKLRKLYLTTRSGVAVVDYMLQDLQMYREDYEINVRIKREEPLYLEDLLTIKYFLEEGKGIIDQYQAFTSLYLCGKSIKSAEYGRELVLEDEDDYNTYSDYIENGLRNYEVFYNYLFKELKVK